MKRVRIFGTDSKFGFPLAKQVLNLLRSHQSHGLCVEYTAYCSQFFGLQMAYESSTLSVLSVS